MKRKRDLECINCEHLAIEHHDLDSMAPVFGPCKVCGWDCTGFEEPEDCSLILTNGI